MKQSLYFGAALIVLTVLQSALCCTYFTAIDPIDIDTMMGKWYAVRGLEHQKIEAGANSKRTKSCPTITLSKVDGGNAILFEWQAKDKPAKKVTLTPSPQNNALWIYKPSKKGSSTGGSFNSLQVSSVSKDNWVGLMCKTGGRMASVILSREPKFHQTTVNKLTQSLVTLGLTTENTFDRCI